MPPRTPLPRICVALGFDSPEKLLEHARREIQEGETFLEMRLDYLPDPQRGLQVMSRVVSEHPDVKVLATCRRNTNHGSFHGSVDEQVRILEAAVAHGAAAVDLEIESAEVLDSPALQSLNHGTGLVVSYHNFESTPAMDAVVRRMHRVEAWAYKIVTTARKPSDVLRLLACGKTTAGSRLILMAMGEIGFPTRVISPAFGSMYTYASPNGAEGTAPGQICARQLRNLDRIEKLGKSPRIFGVIADPVRHSLSPVIHNRALQSKRLEGVYLPFLVPALQLRDFMTVAAKLPLAGFSVTIPHKQKISRYLDIVDPLSRRIGAVNTVWRKAGKWRGTNTDVAGVVVPLKKRMRLAHASVLIAGNGGAARGAAFALADAGAKVTLVGRNAERVRSLARVTGAEAASMENLNGRQFDVFIHATPLGMYPNTSDAFFPDRIPASLIFDMVYNPLETALLRNAKQQGLEVVPGIEMFVEQAAHQFETWTGESAPRSVMEKAVFEALGASSAVQ
ncbi:MAG TPA: shikimate dehydrogenase [Bryobacteraceae bacterium]|nr:shikimate dehydrogenase [Bryobacteraceae bacterium]